MSLTTDQNNDLYEQWEAAIGDYVVQCIESSKTGVPSEDCDLLPKIQKTFQQMLWYFFLYGKYKDNLISMALVYSTFNGGNMSLANPRRWDVNSSSEWIMTGFILN